MTLRQVGSRRTRNKFNSRRLYRPTNVTQSVRIAHVRDMDTLVGRPAGVRPPDQRSSETRAAFLASVLKREDDRRRLPDQVRGTKSTTTTGGVSTSGVGVPCRPEESTSVPSRQGRITGCAAGQMVEQEGHCRRPGARDEQPLNASRVFESAGRVSWHAIQRSRR
jgi:hypothetical protein